MTIKLVMTLLYENYDYFTDLVVLKTFTIYS